MKSYSKIFLYFFSLIFINCKKLERKKEAFYYDVYSSKNKVIAYYRTVSTYDEYFRVDSITRFNLDGTIDEEFTEKFLVKEDTLYKIDFSNNKYPYLIIDLEKCNQIDEGIESETCLIEEEDYLVFTEQTLVIDGVKKRLVFDKSFNLIENEYLDGYLSYYKISKRETKPIALSN